MSKSQNIDLSGLGSRELVAVRNISVAPSIWTRLQFECKEEGIAVSRLISDFAERWCDMMQQAREEREAENQGEVK